MHLHLHLCVLALLLLSGVCAARATFMDPSFADRLRPSLVKNTVAWRGNAFNCKGECRTGEIEVARAQYETSCEPAFACGVIRADQPRGDRALHEPVRRHLLAGGQGSVREVYFLWVDNGTGTAEHPTLRYTCTGARGSPPDAYTPSGTYSGCSTDTTQLCSNPGAAVATIRTPTIYALQEVSGAWPGTAWVTVQPQVEGPYVLQAVLEVECCV
ncbi:hypothetical protein CALVIDRAFT_572961 [Calocera viscosa TUFC12733]|uniref:Lytic polysaccharide monooxygenase n=1 Tax=Calocera viscosa (strain TUFC12733) TaxID=1330018 RepID=A0A167FHS9_CALVF|nr:hypothetical protein CALVIDRAFT_572961 [Calocera viscosa TUFC12733]